MTAGLEQSSRRPSDHLNQTKMPKSFLNDTSKSLGLRNNNPGNLVKTNIDWLGKIPLDRNTDARFEQFYELRYGIRALMRDIYTDYRRGSNTVRKLISEFAPAFENNTESYINTVIGKIGMDLIPQMDIDTLTAIAKAIVSVENGSDARYITDQDYQDAVAILQLALPKKKD